MKNGVMKNGRPILGLADKLLGCYAEKWLVCVCDLFVPFVCYLSHFACYLSLFVCYLSLFVCYLSHLFATCRFLFVICPFLFPVFCTKHQCRTGRKITSGKTYVSNGYLHLGNDFVDMLA